MPKHPTPTTPGTSPLRPGRTDGDAVRFLNERLRPSVPRGRRPPWLSAVGSAIASHDLAPLAGLPERTRRELLEAIEACVERSPSSATPRAVVRLTSVVGAVGLPERALGRRLAPPAR